MHEEVMLLQGDKGGDDDDVDLLIMSDFSDAKSPKNKKDKKKAKDKGTARSKSKKKDDGLNI